MRNQIHGGHSPADMPQIGTSVQLKPGELTAYSTLGEIKPLSAAAVRRLKGLVLARSAELPLFTTLRLMERMVEYLIEAIDEMRGDPDLEPDMLERDDDFEAEEGA